jgi:DNA-directed RNA polymerase subunit RPC12/RpoP
MVTLSLTKQKTHIVNVYELLSTLSARESASLDWFSITITIAVIVLIILILYRFFIIPSLKETRCPRCGSTSIEKTPEQWVTSPENSWGETPVTMTSHYKYRCRKCQNEWEDY